MKATLIFNLHVLVICAEAYFARMTTSYWQTAFFIALGVSIAMMILGFFWRKN